MFDSHAVLAEAQSAEAGIGKGEVGGDGDGDGRRGISFVVRNT